MFDGVRGLLNLALHTCHCPCISVVPELTHMAKLRALEGCCVSSKSNSRYWDQDKGSCWEEWKRTKSMWGHWLALQENQWNFYKKHTSKNWVKGQTWPAPPPRTPPPHWPYGFMGEVAVWKDGGGSPPPPCGLKGGGHWRSKSIPLMAPFSKTRIPPPPPRGRVLAWPAKVKSVHTDGMWDGLD